MTGFRRDRAGVVTARFSAVERRVLRDLLVQVRELVGGPETADPLSGLDPSRVVERPEDPVLARLLPDAYGDDDELAREFRRFSEDELRAGKVRDAIAAVADLDAGPELRLPDAERAEVWLRALNDARLALGTRLGVTEDSWAEMEALPKRSSRRGALQLYHWLGYLQETLLEALDG